MKNNQQSLLLAHGSVVLFGLSGLFGKLLHHPAIVIVFGRVFLSSLFLCALCMVRGHSLRRHRQEIFHLFLSGALLALHWTAFYLSVQQATVAVGLITFCLFPVIVTFVEPWLFRERMRRSDGLLSLLSVAGVMLLGLGGGFQGAKLAGVLWGLVSALSYAFLTLLNRRFARYIPAPVVTFYQQAAAALVLLPALAVYRPLFTGREVGLLLLLGVVCTGVAHTLFVKSLERLRAQTAGMISLLEPVYGIAAAALVLGELPGINEVLGGGVILLAAILSTRAAAAQGR